MLEEYGFVPVHNGIQCRGNVFREGITSTHALPSQQIGVRSEFQAPAALPLRNESPHELFHAHP
jgi:hypothetical protein